MSRLSSCQLDLHKKLHKTVLFHNDKLVKNNLEHEKRIYTTSCMKTHTAVLKQNLGTEFGNKENRQIQKNKVEEKESVSMLTGVHCI